jgi:hypothetical protein
VATLPNFKFEAQQICLPTPPLKLDPTAAQQGLAVVDRPHAVSILNAIWHHSLIVNQIRRRALATEARSVRRREQCFP